MSLRFLTEGSSEFFPDADLVAWIKSPNAEATSLTAFISITYQNNEPIKRISAIRNVKSSNITNNKNQLVILKLDSADIIDAKVNIGLAGVLIISKVNLEY